MLLPDPLLALFLPNSALLAGRPSGHYGSSLALAEGPVQALLGVAHALLHQLGRDGAALLCGGGGLLAAPVPALARRTNSLARRTNSLARRSATLARETASLARETATLAGAGGGRQGNRWPASHRGGGDVLQLYLDVNRIIRWTKVWS